MRPTRFWNSQQKIIVVVGCGIDRPHGDVGFKRIGRDHRCCLHHRKVNRIRALRLVGRVVAPPEKRILDEGDEKDHEKMVLAERYRGRGRALTVVTGNRFQKRPAAQLQFGPELHLLDEIVTTIDVERKVLRHAYIGFAPFIPADEVLAAADQHGVAPLHHAWFAVDQIMTAALKADDEIVDRIGFVDPPGLRMLHADRRARQVERQRRGGNRR